jgi:hypothetical protein
MSHFESIDLLTTTRSTKAVSKANSANICEISGTLFFAQITQIDAEFLASLGFSVSFEVQFKLYSQVGSPDKVGGILPYSPV